MQLLSDSVGVKKKKKKAESTFWKPRLTVGLQLKQQSVGKELCLNEIEAAAHCGRDFTTDSLNSRMKKRATISLG